MTFEFACQKQGLSRACSILIALIAAAAAWLFRNLTAAGTGMTIIIFFAVLIAGAFAVTAIESRFLKYTCTCTLEGKDLVITAGKKVTTYPLGELTSIRTYPMEDRRGTSEPRYWRMVIRAGERKVTVDSVTTTTSETDSNGRRAADRFTEDAKTMRTVFGLTEDGD